MVPRRPIRWAGSLLLVLGLLGLGLLGDRSGDLSLRVTTERAVSSVDVTVRTVRGEAVREWTERVVVTDDGVGRLDLPDDVRGASVTMARVQLRAQGAGPVRQRRGAITFALLEDGWVLDTSSRFVPAVSTGDP